MRNFNEGNRSGGGRDKKEMHQATCSDCGKNCEVPFKPTGDKPVFCDDCFSKNRSRDGVGRPRRSRAAGRDSRGFREKTMHQATCDECGKSCEVPFKPTGDKPVYCSQCFGKSSGRGDSGQSSQQLAAINAKLDKILEALAPAAEKKPAPEKKEAAKAKPKKAATKKAATKAKPKKTTTKKKAKKK